MFLICRKHGGNLHSKTMNNDIFEIKVRLVIYFIKNLNLFLSADSQDIIELAVIKNISPDIIEWFDTM